MNNMQSSEHRSVDELLPWYVNKTLDDRARGEVERHLAVCESCQENVRLWTQVQSSVRKHSPVPFVPEPDTDTLLDAVEQDERGWSVPDKRTLLPLAAAALLVVAIAVAFLASGRLMPETPAQFETVVSESADNTVQYIIEMQFDASATAEQRREILDALGNVTLDTAVDAEVLTLHLGATSLPELQERIDALMAIPHVVDAKIVAVHLPVD